MEDKNDEAKTQCVTDEIKEIIENELQQFANAEINKENLDTLYKLIDIHKDIANEEYWQIKKEGIKMRYREGNYGEYGNYGNYGAYGEDGAYGRRGVPGSGRGRYRGYNDDKEEILEDMHEFYEKYSEGREAYNRGNYSAGQDSMKSLDYMLKSVKKFMKMLKDDSNSQEEVEMIRRTARELSEM